MKLIIDIPDEELYKIEHDRVITDEQRAMLFCAITDGTPVSTDGDSISRKSLLKELNEYNEFAVFDCEAVKDLIDNAPTVEPEKVLVANVTFDADKLKEIVHTEVIEKIKSGELVIRSEERPQGEWILNKDENPECPFCHHSFTYWGNFCGNCGADMR